MKTILITAFLLCAVQCLRSQQINKMKNDKQDSIAIASALEDIYFKGIYEGNLVC
jgi:hypothetical protein